MPRWARVLRRRFLALGALGDRQAPARSVTSSGVFAGKGHRMSQSIPSESILSGCGPTSLGAGWQRLYESAVLELDERRLPERVAVARRAILDRAEEILTTVRTDEHRALSDALRFLLLLEEVVGKESTHPHAA
jgi:hypothetical protein